jgi:aminobenzoyl-glutamate transport protein
MPDLSGPVAVAPKTAMQRFLDMVEKVGNKVPHPVLLFLILIGVVVVLSQLLQWAGTSVVFEVINPATDAVEETTTAVRGLLAPDGVRFMFEGLVPNFLGFVALGQLIAAMLGVGVAEQSGLIDALIRKLVRGAPRWALCYFLVWVGILSSIASNAGYLVLIPLAAVAFKSVGRHPLAGLAAGFAAVGATFSVNKLITPIDAVLVEFTNDAIHLIDPNVSISLTASVWFSIASVLLLTVVITFITERITEPRLGKYQPDSHAAEEQAVADAAGDEPRGLRYALYALLAVVVLIGLLSLPPGAVLRNPDTGDLIGNTPFMNSLIAFIMLLFLACGTAYGFGAGTMRNAGDVIQAMQKTVVGLSGMILMLFVISQFVAYFNYSNMATVLAVTLADALEAAQIGPFWLLVGFILLVAFINMFITGAVGKWAILAPVFVPLLVRLQVEPEAVISAYRVGDSVTNVWTPMLSMFAVIVGFFQRYDKHAGIGTIFAVMLPYVLWMLPLWMLLFAGWYLLGIPWGF